QTARYPIAAISDGLAFRNSLLAGYDNEQWRAPALVALLNSTLVRWLHYARFRDARQPVLPQVKVAHLRAIPAPVVIGDATQTRLSELGERLTGQSEEQCVETRRALDALVYDIYELDETERSLVDAWQ